MFDTLQTTLLIIPRFEEKRTEGLPQPHSQLRPIEGSLRGSKTYWELPTKWLRWQSTAEVSRH